MSVMTAMMSPLSTVGKLIFLGLWYIMYPGSFGGANVLAECLLKHDDFWLTVLDGS